MTRLAEEEAALYQALGNDAYGPAVRLEQELIRWDWALDDAEMLTETQTLLCAWVYYCVCKCTIVDVGDA